MTARRKTAYSFLVLVLALALIEGGLRVLGVARPERAFTEFTDGSGARMVRVELNPMHQEFAREKPAHTYRIMIAGASTVVGFPYQPRSSFALRLQDMLAAALPDVHVEVINLGRMSYWSGEVAQVVHEALQYRPDVMIVYTGNNEFISLSRRKAADADVLGHALGVLRIFRASRRLAAGIKAWFINRRKDPDAGLVLPPPPPISKEDYERSLREFNQNLEATANDCKAAKVPLLFLTPVVNLGDWPPYRFAFPPGMSDKDKNAALESLRQLEAQPRLSEMDADKVQEAEKRATTISAAIKRTPDYAPLYFELGRVLNLEYNFLMQAERLHDQNQQEQSRDQLKNLLAQAQENYSLTLSWEAKSVIVHRAIPEFRSLILSQTDGNRVMVLDLETAYNLFPGDFLECQTHDDGAFILDLRTEFIPSGGNYLFFSMGNLFDDQCHPDLCGQEYIADALFQWLETAKLPFSGGQWKEEFPGGDLDFVKNLQARHGLDHNFLYNVYLSMAIFDGVKAEMPEQWGVVRKLLYEATQEQPGEPMPAILETLVGIKYRDSATPARRLAKIYFKNPSNLTSLVKRHFTSRVDLRDGFFLAKIEHDHKPPFEGLVREDIYKRLKDRSVDLSGPKAPLDYYNCILDLERDGTDVTEQVLKSGKLTRR